MEKKGEKYKRANFKVESIRAFERCKLDVNVQVFYRSPKSLISCCAQKIKSNKLIPSRMCAILHTCIKCCSRITIEHCINKDRQMRLCAAFLCPFVWIVLNDGFRLCQINANIVTGSRGGQKLCNLYRNKSNIIHTNNTLFYYIRCKQLRPEMAGKRNDFPNDNWTSLIGRHLFSAFYKRVF